MKKQYIFQGTTYDKIPDPLPIEGGLSPVTEETFRFYGGQIVETIDPKEVEFEEACRGFRYTCYQVRVLVNDPSFKGGIDEMRDLLKTGVATKYPKEFPQLSTMFQWYDKECTYLGGKLNLGQPAWWYRCWELAPEGEWEQFLAQLMNQQDESTTDPYEEAIESNISEEVVQSQTSYEEEEQQPIESATLNEVQIDPYDE